ncbi:MAG: hypothetical protein IT233_07305 [Bacteroidia bacterium]|nr:hypothetical protein [Bacteroidia bacterium]
MLLLLIVILTTLLLYAGLAKLFAKAGLPAWKAWVPWLNYYHWIRLVERPKWWWYVTFIPVVNMVVFLLIRADLANHFGKRKFAEHLLVWLFPFAAFMWWGYDASVKYTGYSEKEKKMKSAGREWADAIAFAVLAATIIRTFLLEAFTIPTPSLEKSLMVGDFLFVSKVTYGPKLPNTPLALPFMHHTVPLLGIKSYSEWLSLPYYRLPGMRNVERNDIVVFNYPDGDTTLSYMQDRSYYNVVRQEAFLMWKQSNDTVKTMADFMPAAWVYVNNPSNLPSTGENSPFGEKLARPVDKRENYVKRCVGLPGDKLEVRDRVLFINDQPAYQPPDMQYSYTIGLRGDDWAEILDEMDITGYTPWWKTIPGGEIVRDTTGAYFFRIHATSEKFEMLKSHPSLSFIQADIQEKGQWDYSIFPHSPDYPWNNDNFGPFVLPKKGTSVEINAKNIVLYDRIIDVYEENDLKVENEKVYINNKEAGSYTFKMDHYWLMGDNRHNSADSRSWGVVPEDHVVGTPVFIWLSMKDPNYNPYSGTLKAGNIFRKDGKFRYHRMFTFVSRDGLSASFLLPATILFALWYGYSRWKKKKEGTKNPSARKK